MRLQNHGEKWLAGDGLGDVLIRHGDTAVEKPPSGKELGIEQGGTGGAAD